MPAWLASTVPALPPRGAGPACAAKLFKAFMEKFRSVEQGEVFAQFAQFAHLH